MANKHLFSPRLGGSLFVTIALFALTACQTDWQDPTEGSAVKAAIRAQSVYPDGRPDVPTFGAGRDGVTARSAIESYQRSFTTPAGGIGAGAPTSSTAPSTPPPTPTQ